MDPFTMLCVEFLNLANGAESPVYQFADFQILMEQASGTLFIELSNDMPKDKDGTSKIMQKTSIFQNLNRLFLKIVFRPLAHTFYFGQS